jgi:two-component system phosphate regulon sensor histidine kinase PhoR
MQNRLVRSTIIFLAFAMVGIIVIQLLWIRNAVNENRKQFDTVVHTMLARISARFERQESLMTFSATMQVRQSYSVMQPGIDSIKYLIDSLKRIKNQNLISNKELSDYESRKDMLSLDATISELEFMVSGQNKQMRSISEWLQFEYRVQRIPLAERLILGDLAGIIAYEQSISNLDMPLEYAVYEPVKRQTVYATPHFFNERDAGQYQIDLYPNSLVGQSPMLLMKFPDRNKFVLQSLRWLLIVSILFLIVIISAFYRTVALIVRQKKISDVKNDFINNMTHEFKTPIATINLATDALNSIMKSHNIPENAFTGIIRQESSRMHRHIERILQIALLEREKVALKPEVLDIIPLINNIIKSFSLRVKEFGGEIIFHAPTNPVLCRIDMDHFVNSIYNLLDNSLKYNENTPLIEIRVSVTDNHVSLSVSDNGIGMNKDTARKVFDKFYRAHTGNTHNVKGFGLGLSYVKLVVEKMNGTVEVDSEPGKGSVFTLTFENQPNL